MQPDLFHDRHHGHHLVLLLTHAHHNDAAPWLHEINGLLNHAGNAHGLDHHVRHQHTGLFGKLLKHIAARIDGGGRTDTLSQGTALVGHLTDNHIGSAHAQREGCRSQTDRSGSQHQHVVSRPHLRAVDRMQADSQRLHQRALLEAHILRQSLGLRDTNPDIFRIGAGHLSKADRLHVRPHPGFGIFEADRRNGRNDDRQCCHPLPFSKAALNLGPQTYHFAGELVSHHRPFRQGEGTMLRTMKIRPADTAGLDLEDELVGSRVRRRNVAYGQWLARPFENCSLHERPPKWCFCCLVCSVATLTQSPGEN